ncbi:MAG: alkaline phosphatase D family protein, partial [Polyangiaceae bacterium]
TERAEILAALAGTRNLVALTGDIHAFYASEIHVDPSEIQDDPVCVEYVCAGISSSPVQEIAQGVVDSSDAFIPLKNLVPQFDTILANTSPEYKYVASLAHGVAVVEVHADTEITVEFIQIDDVKSKDWDGTVSRKKFRTASGTPRIETM